MTHLEIVSTTCDGIDVSVDGRPVALSWMWLRDHARDPASFHAAAHQRLVPPSDVASASTGHASVTDGGLEVSWPGGPVTVFDRAFLAGLGDAFQATDVGRPTASWDRSTIASRIAPVGFDELVGAESGLAAAVDQLWANGLVVIDAVPTDLRSTRQVLERFGYVRSTIFGDVWEFSSDGGFDDTASTPLEITPHTDGTYSADAPGLLGLHCQVYAATGGENVFVDGSTLATQLSEAARRVLALHDIPGQYIGDGAHLMAKRPVLRYEAGHLIQVSYNHHDRAPFVLPEPAMTELYEALHEFHDLAARPELQFDLALRPGDMVLFDNWRVLHGRRAFRGERTLAGGYINREDFESTTRLVSR